MCCWWSRCQMHFFSWGMGLLILAFALALFLALSIWLFLLVFLRMHEILLSECSCFVNSACSATFLAQPYSGSILSCFAGLGLGLRWSTASCRHLRSNNLRMYFPDALSRWPSWWRSLDDTRRRRSTASFGRRGSESFRLHSRTLHWWRFERQRRWLRLVVGLLNRRFREWIIVGLLIFRRVSLAPWRRRWRY